MKGGPTFLKKKKIRKDKNNQSKEKENEGKRDMNLNIRIKYNNRAIKGEGGFWLNKNHSILQTLVLASMLACASINIFAIST